MKRRANGEGSVFFNERTQRWNATGPNGVPIRSGTTQAEAIRRRDLAVAKTGNISRISAKRLLSEYLRDWLSTKRVRERTHDGYSVTIELHIIPHIGHIAIGKLTPQHVQRCLDLCGSQWTRAKVYQLLNAALGLAARWDVLGKNPVERVTRPSVTSPPAVPMAEDDFYAFLAEIAKDRLFALWLLMVAVGPRRGEAIAVSRSGLNLDAGTVTFTRSIQRVRGKLAYVPAKTQKGNRTVSLPPPVSEALRAHLVRQKEERLKAGEQWEDCDLLFCTRRGTPLEPRNVTRRFHQILAAAGIPKTKLHNLRHTAASILLRERTDIYAVQEMLGHARGTTTVSIYGHRMSAPNVTAEKMTEVLNRRK